MVALSGYLEPGGRERLDLASPLPERIQVNQITADLADQPVGNIEVRRE